ncbi:hypothetical protein [Halobacteriovorax sp. RZ-2]|uniref:hypothetical protein n=1 Tax=unclassified Halobacteriovorax TaxID=2639665 RepID=UPI0037198CC0
MFKIERRLSRLDYLKRLKSESLNELSSQDESISNYSIVKFDNFTIGLKYFNDAYFPPVVVFETDKRIFIGLDKKLFQLDDFGRLLGEADLDFYISEIIPFNDVGIIVLFEIGACFYDLNFRCMWNISLDFIEDFKINNDALILDTNSGQIEIEVCTGKLKK